MLVPILLILAPAIPLFGIALYLWRVFYRSPERVWRVRVFQRLRAVESRLACEQFQMPTITARQEQETAQLRERSFERLLHGESVERLHDYPGIGSGTVTRLRDAGYVNLAILRQSRIHVAGLGERRLADISAAVEKLLREAQSRFEAGACPEAQDLASELVTLNAKYEDLECRSSARSAAAAAVAGHLRKLVAVARTVTAWNYFSAGENALVPDNLLAAPLPDLERTVAHAEENAIRALEQRRKQAATHGQHSRPAEPATRDAERVASDVLPLPAINHLRPGHAAAEPVASPQSRVLQPALAPATPPPARRDLFREALRPENPSHILPVEHGSTPGPTTAAGRQESADETYLSIMELTIQLAYTAARADGRIVRKERDIIAEHLQRRFGHDPALHNRAKALSAHYETAAIDVEACLRRIAELLTVEQRAVLMDFVSRILDASGSRTPREISFLEKLARRLGVQAPNVETASHGAYELASTDADPLSHVATPATTAIAAPPAPGVRVLSRDECLAILEIDSAAPLSPEVVRRQFNLLRERFAPHRFDAMGPEFMEMARKKLQAIETAATVLLQTWGQVLEPEASRPLTTELRHNPDLDAVFGV